MSIKVRSHLQVKRKNGEYIGAFTPFGYRKAENDHNQLEIDDYAASVVEDIFRWKLEGMSQDGIAKRLTADGILSPWNIRRARVSGFKTGFETGKQTQWTSVAVRRILTNPVYIGTLIQGIRTKPNYKINTVIVNDEDKWVKVENAHKPIVSERFLILCKGFCCWTHELHLRKGLCIHWPGWLFAETVKVRWLRLRPVLVAKNIATIFVILTKNTKAVPAVIEFPKAIWSKLSCFFSESISVWYVS